MRVVAGMWTWTQDVTINESWPMILFGVLGALVLIWCWFRRRNQNRWYFWPLPLLLPCLILVAGSAANNHFGLYVRLGDLVRPVPVPHGICVDSLTSAQREEHFCFCGAGDPRKQTRAESGIGRRSSKTNNGSASGHFCFCGARAPQKAAESGEAR